MPVRIADASQDRCGLVVGRRAWVEGSTETSGKGRTSTKITGHVLAEGDAPASAAKGTRLSASLFANSWA